MPHDTLTQWPLPCSVTWCLADVYRNRDPRRPTGLCGSGMNLLSQLSLNCKTDVAGVTEKNCAASTRSLEAPQTPKSTAELRSLSTDT